MAPVPQPDDENNKGPSSDDDFNEIENVMAPEFIINDADSGSESSGEENDQEDYMGYQMLPQSTGDIEMDVNMQESSDNIDVGQNSVINVDTDTNSETGAVGGDCNMDKDLFNNYVLHQSGVDSPRPGYMQVPDLPKPDPKDLLWNKQRPSAVDMDPGHADKVKAVMSGIRLPSVNIPDWAKDINEDQWKEKLAQLKHHENLT